jgi:hypothetical protein
VAWLCHVYQRPNLGDWWSDHTFSGDAHNLTIDDKPMGTNGYEGGSDLCGGRVSGGGAEYAGGAGGWGFDGADGAVEEFCGAGAGGGAG